MNQSYAFVGQHLFSQVLSLVDKSSLRGLVKENRANRYYKQLYTWEHFVAMMYGVLAGCTSLREIVLGLASFEGRLAHLNLRCIPARSTLSDGNRHRSAEVFKQLYQQLYRQYKPSLSDSTLDKGILEKLFLVDATVFQLFKAILKTTGRYATDGRTKGGIKKNTVLHGHSLMPVFVQFQAAAEHDQKIYDRLSFAQGSYVVFDKGYTNYTQFAYFTDRGVFFITRLKDNAAYITQEEFEPNANTPDQMLKDERIEVSYKNQDGVNTPLSLRRIAWWVEKEKRTYEFITNNMDLAPQMIAQLYQYRWKIELFFKKLKQNFPLKYFVGDNQNAIEIQIWCALIALLLLSVLHAQHKTKMAFSLMVSLVRQHLFNYLSLKKILSLAYQKRTRIPIPPEGLFAPP